MVSVTKFHFIIGWRPLTRKGVPPNTKPFTSLPAEIGGAFTFGILLDNDLSFLQWRASTCKEDVDAMRSWQRFIKLINVVEKEPVVAFIPKAKCILIVNISIHDMKTKYSTRFGRSFWTVNLSFTYRIVVNVQKTIEIQCQRFDVGHRPVFFRLPRVKFANPCAHPDLFTTENVFI